jgi:hypothetical protein
LYICRFAEQIGRCRHLLVGRGVHEDVVGTVAVEELHVALLDDGLLELLVGAVRALDHGAAADVLELGAHERPALARFHVLELDDAEQALGEVQAHAVFQVIGRDCHGCPL